MATAAKERFNETLVSDIFDETRILLDSDCSSNYASYAATVSTNNVDSEKLGETDDEIIEKKSKDQMNFKPSEELTDSFEEEVANSAIPMPLLRKIKSYIFILSQKEKEFTIFDLKREFNDKLEIADKVDLEHELQKLGIVTLKYCEYLRNSHLMIPDSKFLEDYARKKGNSKASMFFSTVEK